MLNALHVPLPDEPAAGDDAGRDRGLVYNFLPFMVLPLYASLEKLDPRLIEAAATSTRARSRGHPGRAAAVDARSRGGTLLTFIPAAGDYINAQLPRTNRQFMIGNVIPVQVPQGR
ncbi:hypothetical protein GCM10020218_074400 [Dactylosporangium vinaceum]